MTPKITRFRAYQLGCAGSSFSYFADGHFTIIEARLNDTNSHSLFREMAICGVDAANCLHITSWDSDHCSLSELTILLDTVLPSRIECPGYEPSSDSAIECSKIIRRHEERKRHSNRPVTLKYITPEYISGLNPSEQLAFRDVVYHPRWLDDNCHNNNSTVKIFRKGSFNLLSLGDVEDENLSAQLRRDKYLKREVDVMILAHHGADNGFTNKKFLRNVAPQLAICSSNYDNQYDHPREDIRQLLYDQHITLMTTKTGDIIVKSIGDHTGNFRAINLRAGSTEVSSSYDFRAKKAKLLSYNGDTIRQIYTRRPAYRWL
jgi:competence protein ComEC